MIPIFASVRQLLKSTRLISIRSVAALFAAALMLAQSAVAEELASFRTGKITVTLTTAGMSGDSEQYKLILKPIGGIQNLDFDLTAKVFALASPTRLVADLPNVGAQGDQKIGITNDLVSSIRIGAHTDKTRFVIDIKHNATAAYNVRSDAASESLVVEFTLTADAAAPGLETPDIEPTPKPTHTPKATPVPKQSPTPAPAPIDLSGSGEEASSSSTSSSRNMFVFRNNQPVDEPPVAKPTAEPQPEVDPEPVVPPPVATTAPQNGSSQTQTTAATAIVKGIYFQAPTESKVGSVSLDVESLGAYRINQLSDESYELIIEGAKLAGPHMVLPQFPPDTFGGFQVLLAREERGNVAIKIFVSKGTKLNPYRAQDKLWIKALDGE